jgi:hypothetical protein
MGHIGTAKKLFVVAAPGMAWAVDGASLLTALCGSIEMPRQIKGTVSRDL